MADSLRKRIVKALSETLKTITPANGYEFDFSDFTDEVGRTRERVFRGRTRFGDADPLPMLVIMEDPTRRSAETGGTGGRQNISPFALLIQGFAKGDENHRLDVAYDLSAQVTKALAKEARRPDGPFGMGPRIGHVQIGQPVHRGGDDDISDHAYMLIGLTMMIYENLQDPYA